MRSFLVIIVGVLSLYVHLSDSVFKELSLDSQNAVWTLENKNGSIKVQGSVPGGVYSDLMKAVVIGDILEGFNDVLTRWVAYDTWTYSGRFNVTDDLLNSAVARLVLNGVDTIAYVEINGKPILTTNNMFVRYTIDVKDHLMVGENELKLSFESPVMAANERSAKHFTLPECVPKNYNGECHANQLRKMQASFAWDWGPAFPSVGLWKTAKINFFDDAVIRTVTTHTKKKDGFWVLDIKTYMESGYRAKTISVQIEARIKLEGDQSRTVARIHNVTTANDGSATINIQMILSDNVVRAWWPNGYGRQNLYDLDVVLRSDNGEISRKHMRVGFRVSELVQVDVSDKISNATFGQGLTFHFEVNGYPLFMKGSNWIPAHILPEYSSDKDRIDDLLLSAKETHMSMLRVWGGGVYEDEYFYKRCDEYGILIWQDLLFACSMYPADLDFLNNVKTEIEQTVINLKSHPSIALWAGNNENEAALMGNWYGTAQNFEKYKEEYIKLYVETIRPIVENLDDNAYVVSSPSNGLKSEMDGYLSRNPYDPNYGDTHYYNYMADNWDFNIYPKTRFASEYGFQSLPSLATMRKATKNPKDFAVDSLYSKHRQHSPGGYEAIENQVNRHLQLDKNDTKYFEKFVFYSQITQAMAIKTETEFYRQSQEEWYTMGALYWQLNDVWQAPSWSSIEYGGKWKMLHYFARSFFAPVLVSPRLLESGDVDVYLINDRFVPIINATIIVDVFNFTSLTPASTQTYKAYVPALSSRKQDFSIKLWNQQTDEIFLKFTLQAPGVKTSPHNYVFPKPLKTVKGLSQPDIQITVSKQTQTVTNNKHKYTVRIHVNRVVLFLWLEAEDIRGKFQDNGFIVTTPSLRVTFISSDDLLPQALQKKITCQYYVNN
ncbi:unnamed protein product [Chilo suppressalis]|uniref:beta-mannosidase n=1 Tax=Chilo suppressalis TaxID=168631 RepID=A0ABN8B4Q5_CHISP|nr:unnamed protein product [Chilo suppressalis]